MMKDIKKRDEGISLNELKYGKDPLEDTLRQSPPEFEDCSKPWTCARCISTLKICVFFLVNIAAFLVSTAIDIGLVVGDILMDLDGWNALVLLTLQCYAGCSMILIGIALLSKLEPESWMHTPCCLIVSCGFCALVMGFWTMWHWVKVSPYPHLDWVVVPLEICSIVCILKIATYYAAAQEYETVDPKDVSNIT